MSTLYDISERFRTFNELIESGNIPEEAIADTLESLEGEFNEKIDNIVALIKEKRAEASAIKAEADNLTARFKSKESKANALARYVDEALKRAGREVFESARHRVSYITSHPVDIEDEDSLVKWLEANGFGELLAYRPPAIKKTELKQALTRGEAFPGVTISDRKNIQIR